MSDTSDDMEIGVALLEEKMENEESNLNKGIWVTRYKEKIHISEMSSGHIVNIIMGIKNKRISFYNKPLNKEWVKKLRKELWKREDAQII